MATKLLYAGDTFGHRIGQTLILGCSDHHDHELQIPHQCNISLPKSYVPLSENFSIDWQNATEPIENAQKTLLDRPFLEIGVEVRHRGRRGKIVKKTEIGTVKILNGSETYCIGNVAADRLKQITGAVLEREVLFDDHIGAIESVTHQVKMAFANGSMCNINFSNNNDFYHGAAINPTFNELKRASWCCSGFNIASLRILQNIAKTAHVVDIDVDSLQISWACPLPPATVGEVPPPTVNGNQLGNLKYLPGKCDALQVGVVRKLEITDDDLQNLFYTEEQWLNSIFNNDGDDGDDSDNEEIPEKRQKLDVEVLQSGSVQPVQLLAVQSLVEIQYETGETEEIPSSALDEILLNNSLEIQRREYVTKIDQTYPYSFGLVLNYFEGEAEQTPMNPRLNPQNMTQVQWFTVNENDTDQIEIGELEEFSIFDLQSLRISPALRNADYVTRVRANDDFTVASFVQILENGKIELKDLDGNTFQKWPTQVSVRDSFNPSTFLTKICETLPSPVPTDEFWGTSPIDMEKATKSVVFASAPFDLPNIEPNNPSEYSQGLHKNLQSLLDKSNPLYAGKWIHAYQNRADLFSALVMGKQGTLFEDLIFHIKIQLTPDFPTKSPLFTFAQDSNLSQSSLWDSLTDVSFMEWDEDRTILDGVDALQGLIESTQISQVKNGDILLPISFLYPNLDGAEQSGWQNRWNEVIAIQSIRFVYNSIAYPSQLKDVSLQIVGHYRHKLPTLLRRWESWTRSGTASPGFIRAVQNQLTRFEPFIVTDHVQLLYVPLKKDNESDSTEGFDTESGTHNGSGPAGYQPHLRMETENSEGLSKPEKLEEASDLINFEDVPEPINPDSVHQSLQHEIVTTADQEFAIFQPAYVSKEPQT